MIFLRYFFKKILNFRQIKVKMAEKLADQFLAHKKLQNKILGGLVQFPVMWGFFENFGFFTIMADFDFFEAASPRNLKKVNNLANNTFLELKVKYSRYIFIKIIIKNKLNN